MGYSLSFQSDSKNVTQKTPASVRTTFSAGQVEWLPDCDVPLSDSSTVSLALAVEEQLAQNIAHSYITSPGQAD